MDAEHTRSINLLAQGDPHSFYHKLFFDKINQRNYDKSQQLRQTKCYSLFSASIPKLRRLSRQSFDMILAEFQKHRTNT